MTAALFPVFLKLAERKVVIVGGGAVAAAKLLPLLDAGARVTVVAPEVSSEIAGARVSVIRRPFQDRDLDDAFFAVAAAPVLVNRQVRAAGEARRIFVNAVDHPDAASAYTGGVLRRGGVTIAVSTDGRAPALAGLLREGLEALIPDEIDAWVETAHALRQQQKASGVPQRERRPRLLEALVALYARRAHGTA
jgi:uroporphyrin-III C-methyltransferase/precorrin-2 dehydrogenase/sirohydrochlorin ferrochelatase